MLLTIALFGKKQSDHIAHVARTIQECECMIQESRMSTVGAESVISLLVEGNWNHIAKLENSITPLADDLGLTVFCSRTESSDEVCTMLPYTAEIFGIEHNGLLAELGQFFTSNNIEIREMTTNCYPASHTGTNLFTANFVLELPSDIKPISLREEFLDFCDKANLDAILEPLKH